MNAAKILTNFTADASKSSSPRVGRRGSRSHDFAQYMWRKHRAARFFAQQAAWFQMHPGLERLTYVEQACHLMAQFNPADAWNFIDLLPEPFRYQIRQLVSAPPSDKEITASPQERYKNALALPK